MRRVSSIALNTFRESVREKLLFVALIFGGILTLSTYLLSPLAVGAKQKIVTDVSLASISILGVLAAIFVGSTLVRKEVDKKAVFMVLTRPVSRLQYLIGKFIGVVMAISLLVLVMTGFMVLMMLIGKAEFKPALFVAVYLSALEITVMCSVVIFFSTFTTPVLTLLFSMCIFVAGSLSGDLLAFAQKFGGAFTRIMARAFHYILPNLGIFNLRHEAVHDLPFFGSDVALATLYALVYCGVVLYFAYLIFRRREFI